jgi:hypothetical protein
MRDYPQIIAQIVPSQHMAVERRNVAVMIAA